MDKQERIQRVADRLASLLQIVDMSALELKDDIDLIDEAEETLKSQISTRESAAVLITALGGSYDSLEDNYKLKTIKIIKELLKLRNEFGEALKKQKEDKQNRVNILKMFNL